MPSGEPARPNRIAAYRCPLCGGGVMSAVDIASLTRSIIPGRPARFRLRCSNPDCPSSGMEDPPGMTVEAISDPSGKKVRFSVPCILCGGIHTAAVSSDILASREIFAFPCPSYGVDICFAGEIRRVKYELSRTELELLDMMSEGDSADVSLEPDREKALPDPEISETLITVTKLLEEEGKVYCSCPEHTGPGSSGSENGDGEPADSRLSFELLPHAVVVTCSRCGAKKMLPAVSYNAARDFAETDELILDE